MNISLDILRAFAAAAETQSFTRAAEQIHMTQPAFSRMMSGLEELWQIRLFNRTTRKVELTQAGKACYLTVVQILDQYDRMLGNVEKIRRTLTGELKIGCNSLSAMSTAFIHSVRAMKREYPGIRVFLQKQGSIDLVPMVERGELDCAIVWSKSVQSGQDLEMLKIGPTHKYAVLSSNSPLAQSETVSLRDLVGLPLIFLKEKEARTCQITMSLANERGIRLFEADSAGSYDEMIMRVSLGSEAAVSAFAYPDHYFHDVVFRPIRDMEREEINGWYTIIWRRDNTNQGVQILTGLMRQQTESVSCGIG